jgi:hypothetical protein
MNLTLQWIIAAGCLVWAVCYLLNHLGLFALLGWARRRPACTCGGCPLARRAQQRMKQLLEPDND